jgi:hypothetical protein
MVGCRERSICCRASMTGCSGSAALGLSLAQVIQVHPRAEGRPSRAHHDDTDLAVRLQRVEVRAQPRQHGAVERIALVRAVERHRRDPARERAQHLVGHPLFLSSSSPSVRVSKREPPDDARRERPEIAEVPYDERPDDLEIERLVFADRDVPESYHPPQSVLELGTDDAVALEDREDGGDRIGQAVLLGRNDVGGEIDRRLHALQVQSVHLPVVASLLCPMKLL